MNKDILQENKPVVVEDTITVTSFVRMYKILLHNDDVNNILHVVDSLVQVFKFDGKIAFKIMLEAHLKGLALCKTEAREQAEFHREQLQSLSLTATIEPET